MRTLKLQKAYKELKKQPKHSQQETAASKEKRVNRENASKRGTANSRNNTLGSKF